jgi:hypothetical protein
MSSSNNETKTGSGESLTDGQREGCDDCRLKRVIIKCIWCLSLNTTRCLSFYIYKIVVITSFKDKSLSGVIHIYIHINNKNDKNSV